MINYFFYPQSFRTAMVEDMVCCLNDLNHAVLNRNEQVETFYYDQNLYALENEKGEVLYHKICENAPFLVRRVLPAMLNHFQYLDNPNIICDDIDNLRNHFPLTCCLFGLFGATSDCYHIGCFEEFERQRLCLAREILSVDTFESLSPMLFEKLNFTQDALEQLFGLGQAGLERLFAIFEKLSRYCCCWKNGALQLSVMKSEYGIDVSDESDTVKNNKRLKAQRCFSISKSIGTQYCFLHVKTGDIRIHFFPDDDCHEIYIAYIGKHLDTKNF